MIFTFRKKITVTGCVDCPFKHYAGGLSACWLTGEYIRNLDDNYYPSWCELQDTERLVTLRTKSK